MNPAEIATKSPSSKRHSRNLPTRTSLSRRSTKGPLDDAIASSNDPLQAESGDRIGSDPVLGPAPEPPAVLDGTRRADMTPVLASPHPKDLSFLYRPSLYHRLPPPPQYASLAPSNPTTMKPGDLFTLLSSHGYRSAAEFCAFRLTHSGSLSQMETFSLFQTRLACLIILDYAPLAAQELAVLEDINGPFYRPKDLDPMESAAIVADGGAAGSILPWELQVMWARLIGIAHGDVRRSIMAYHDLARHARSSYRDCLLQSKQAERVMWKRRIEELGLGLASVLVEAGDLEAAAGHLERLDRRGPQKAVGAESKEKDDDENSPLAATIASRRALVYLALGDIDAAARCLQPRPRPTSLVTQDHTPQQYLLIRPLISIAAGRYEEAVEQLREQLKENAEGQARSSSNLNAEASNALIRQNLAVALFYTGHVEEAIATLEDLIDGSGDGDKGKKSTTDNDRGHGIPRSFRALTFNLATCFELTSEKAASKKATLAERVSRGLRDSGNWAERDGGAFKL